jgi:hypothetical protein
LLMHDTSLLIIIVQPDNIRRTNQYQVRTSATFVHKYRYISCPPNNRIIDYR